jgi:hypothetical protein
LISRERRGKVKFLLIINLYVTKGGIVLFLLLCCYLELLTNILRSFNDPAYDGVLLYHVVVPPLERLGEKSSFPENDQRV